MTSEADKEKRAHAATTVRLMAATADLARCEARLALAERVIEAAEVYNEHSHHVDGCPIRYATTRPGAACGCGKHALTLRLAEWRDRGGEET